tara:strand:- start:129 stop:1328 length:1200 start_codon:yes stop_codon:yes gene_type:complete
MVKNQFLFNQFGDVFGQSDFQENHSFRRILTVTGDIGGDPGGGGGGGHGGGGTGGTDDDGWEFNNYYTQLNTIMWGNYGSDGLNSEQALTPAGLTTGDSDGWDLPGKTTKYITELIAMDFQAGTEYVRGMDYRTQVTLTTGETVGEDSLMTAKMNNDLAANMTTGGPLGEVWPSFLRSASAENLNTMGNYGSVPGEFISCSGYNQKNCSLAARTRQILADDIADVTYNDNTNKPLSTTGNSNYWAPVVFSNEHLIPFTSEDPNPSVLNETNNIPTIPSIMGGIPLENIVEGTSAGDKGIPMGLFFNISKFIFNQENTLTTSTETPTTLTYYYNSVYRLRAGFKFIENKNSLASPNQFVANANPFHPTLAYGIHLGGNNTTDPSIVINTDTGNGELGADH